jgi:hypothetical protein
MLLVTAVVGVVLIELVPDMPISASSRPLRQG